MNKLRRFWEIMWTGRNKIKTIFFNLLLSIMALGFFTGFQIVGYGGGFDVVTGSDTWWAGFIPLGLLIIIWVGSYISYNKRGVLDRERDPKNPF